MTTQDEQNLIDAALDARVPEEDYAGPGSEPFRRSGWYAIKTVSGRDAWERYSWQNGRVVEGVRTYDRAAEDAAVHAGLLREEEIEEESDESASEYVDRVAAETGLLLPKDCS